MKRRRLDYGMSKPTQSERVQVVLPAKVAAEAKQRADDACLSLSAFLCMGIAEWLRGRGGDNSLQSESPPQMVRTNGPG